MNKLMLCGLLIWTSLSFSQVSFGVKGGVNLSSLSVEQDFIQDNLSSRIGFHIGFAARADISDKIALQPELYYSRQGYNAGEVSVFNGNQIPVVVDRYVNLNYINLPVLINYNIVSGLDLQAGPQVGFGLSGKTDANVVSGDLSDFNDDLSADFDISTAEIGIAAGLQYRINKLFFQARYVLGLTGIAKGGEGGKNRNVQISVGYKLF